MLIQPNLKNITPQVNVTSDTISAKLKCEFCPNTFTAKSSLDRHLKDRCKGQKALKEKQRDEVMLLAISTANEVASLKSQLAALADKPQSSGNTNNLNVMCLGSKDNILDILVAKQGILKALTIVKQSALCRLPGACTILQKVYLPEGERPAIMHPGKSKTTYVYYDENNQRVVEKNSSVMAKKLADIVQRTYLKGMSCLKKDILGVEKTGLGQPYQAEMSKLKQIDLRCFELDPYDIESWMASVHELRDEKCQKKLLKQLSIPFEDEC